ncbi:MAG: YdeI/OmpD-associated family protein [Coprobacillus sp.]
MNAILYFKTRDEFRNWLLNNCESTDGVWLAFSNSKQCITLKASEALEEALCFGWIDGLMKKVDDTMYIKYFSQRRKNSVWSQKNKEIVEKLEQQDLMTNYGREKIEEAKKNGNWDNASKPSAITDEQINQLNTLLMVNEVAYTHFQNMSQSVKKTYTRAYLDAKTESGRNKRLEWIIDRLEKNLKPM